jgi:hypothetical protein
MSSQSEPRNPFYLLLLVVGMIFIATVLAYAVVPVIEQKAMDAGQMPPPSPFRDALREDGWKWVLIEVGLMVVLGLASMGLDRWRRARQERASQSETTKVEAPPPA